MPTGVYERTELHKKRMSDGLKGHKSYIWTEEQRKKLSEKNKRLGVVPPSRNGIKHTEEYKKNLSEDFKRKGYLPPNLKGLKRSDSFKKKIRDGHAKYWSGKRGKDSANWKDGRTPLRSSICKINEYKVWRLSVFERDKFLCQFPSCDKSDRYLEAHHIKTVIKILRENDILTVVDALKCDFLWSINNGITLCRTCHNKIQRREEQYEELFYNILRIK